MRKGLGDPGPPSQTQPLTQVVCNGFQFALMGDPQPFVMAQVFRKQPLAPPIPLRLLPKVPLSGFLVLPTQGGWMKAWSKGSSI